MKQRPGIIRDSIIEVLTTRGSDGAHWKDIHTEVGRQLGVPVAASSVRSYLGKNTPEVFLRTSPGHYVLTKLK